MEWRYLAYRATTREPLHLDLPLNVSEIGWALSGAGGLRATVAPDVGGLRASDGRLLLEEWGTLLFAEADGEIRWGGIVLSSGFEGEEWQIEAAQIATYPHGMVYTGPVYEKIDVDPAQVVRDIWTHLQAQPDGNLGVTVTGSSPARIGKAAVPAKGEEPEVPAEPYALYWYEAPDLGGEIDTLRQEGGFDFTETHRWAGDSIASSIDIAYPRAGRRRTDLAFRQGDNVSAVVTPTYNGDAFANTIIGLGAGEGAASVHRTNAARDGRLRRTAVYSDKAVTAAARMDALIAGEAARRRAHLEISTVEVVDHPNAPLGSWALGDDVLIEARLPWLGDIAEWCRVVAWSLTSDSTARLTLARSDSFAYGG